jgi:peptidoglycan/xylan/chitin deacetylase (PgdA/CDA1 family)
MRSWLPPLLTLLACAPRALPRDEAPGVEVAVTVDDLPLHGPLLEGQTRMDLARTMTAVFRAHGLPPVHGFVNGAAVEGNPWSEEVLAIWKKAGHLLGNHSWAHRNLDDTPLEQYLADIARNEPLLARLEPNPAAWHVYRYPYLHEGADLEKRRAVRRALAERGYTIAEVSLDGDDWAFSSPLARCAAKHDAAAMAQLRADFIAVQVDELRRMRALGKILEQRELRHVLLLHLGVADVDALDGLLTAYEREGVRWVTLERALADPFYAQDPDIAFKSGAAFPYVVARARGVKVEPPIYQRGLEERLETICR